MAMMSWSKGLRRLYLSRHIRRRGMPLLCSFSVPTRPSCSSRRFVLRSTDFFFPASASLCRTLRQRMYPCLQSDAYILSFAAECWYNARLTPECKMQTCHSCCSVSNEMP
ncbi:hypothetical protein BDZ89DRAFT_68249 [Hymenopellis radicata]|nr:hypothetical protein BDZ89DRAFT_68249 [Hymenopellis radicata]